MKKTLIFDEQIAGHHLEYIHHLYMGGLEKINEDFVFFLSPDFKKVSTNLVWPTAPNITIKYIADADISKLNKNKLLKSLYLSKILRRISREYSISHIFLVSLMQFLPFLPLVLNKRIRVSGIVYLIYLYRWKKSSFFVRVSDLLKYLLLSRFKIFENIYLLNDSVAPVYLNKKYKTSVFKYLPDPFVPVSVDSIKNLREELRIPLDKIVLLHFGALSDRKGTISILKAIAIANENILSHCCFIFAGKVFDDIKESFYSLTNDLEKHTQIVIFDTFCSYDYIGSLCLTSNYILMPYKDSEQSSGVLGYAAQFKVPVVGPSVGLLGKLIKKYKLGLLLENCSEIKLKDFINGIYDIDFKVKTSYTEEKTVLLFINTIFR